MIESSPYLKEINKERLRIKYLEKELCECTFQPEIDPISRKLGDIFKENRNFKDVHNNLYFESYAKKTPT